jgi:flagellar biogenesis protein FliO
MLTLKVFSFARLKRVAFAIALVGITLVFATHASAQTASTEPAATQPAFTTHDPFADLPSYGDMIRRTLYTLLGILIAFILAAKYLPRLFGRAPFTPRGRLIQVIERHPLEARKTVYLLKVADQYFLIASTPEGVSTLAGGSLDQDSLRQRLAELERPKETKSPKPRQQPEVSFTEVLRGK